MNLRQKTILRELLNGESTTAQLAELLDVTTRTIRNDIRDINECLEGFEASIDRIEGRKLKLHTNNDDKFKKFLSKYMETKSLNFCEPENRIIYIALKYLFSSDYIKQEDFIDELYVSRSTLQNDFKEVRDMLEKYDLGFEVKPNYGGRLVGDESDIRNAISDILYRTTQNQFLDETKRSILLYDEDKLKTIYDIVLDNVSSSNINLSDMALSNLVVHIAIALRRVEVNHYISKDFDSDLDDNYEYKIAKNIVYDIEDEFDIEFPHAEVYYITMHLMGTKLVLMDNEDTKLDEEEIFIKKLAIKLIEYAERRLGYNLLDDKELLYGIVLHLKPAIHRFRNDMNIRNPLLSSIKSNYPLVFSITVEATKIIEDDLDIQFNEDEIGYLAIHLGAAVERAKLGKKPIRTLVVCTTGVGSSQLLRYKLEAKFPNQLEIKKTTEFYNLKNINSDEYDLIISTVPLGDYDRVPYIVVNDILGESNFESIGNYIDTRGSGEKKRYLNINDIYLDLDFETKEEIIKFLCDKAVESNRASSDLYESVIERENIAQTSFGNNVAIPHPMKLMSNETFWMLGVLKNPIDWSGKKVSLVILLNVAVDEEDSLKDMYNILLEVIDDRELVGRIINSDYKDEIYRIMNNI